MIQKACPINNTFSFVSTSGEISVTRDGRGPPNFVLQGQLCHSISSIKVTEGWNRHAQFSQVYIHDPTTQMELRKKNGRLILE